MKPSMFALLNTGVGFVVAVALTHYVLPIWGYIPNLMTDITVTLIYTVASLIRNDLIYRFWRKFVGF